MLLASPHKCDYNLQISHATADSAIVQFDYTWFLLSIWEQFSAVQAIFCCFKYFSVESITAKKWSRKTSSFADSATNLFLAYWGICLQITNSTVGSGNVKNTNE